MKEKTFTAVQEHLPQTPEHFEKLQFTPVAPRHSLFVRVFMALLLNALVIGVLAIVLTSQAHRSILELLLPMGQLDNIRTLLVGVLLMVGMATVGISGAVAWILTNYFSRPIAKLGKAMERAVHADLDVTIESKRKDEFGSLFTFFNSMMAQIREARYRNDAITELKSQFVSIAAHQLRTPLTSIRWTLESLHDEENSLTKQQKETVHIGVETTDTMLRLVNQLLNVAEAEEGKFSSAFVKIDISKFIDDIVESYGQLAAANTVAVNVVRNIREGLSVVGDVMQLKLALSNILENAVKYTRPGGKVDIVMQQEKDWLHIAVTDTGIGIPDDQISKIGTKFFRASNARAVQPNGSGLGLYIVSNVVKSHGGKFTISSSVGKGTTIAFTLPLRKELVPKESLTEGIAVI